MENRYALQAYGIQVDQLPISYFGKIKVAYVRQWVSARAAIEQYEKLVSDGHNPLPNRVIEYPQPEDVVFRPGVSTAQHPGNAFLINYFTTILLNEQKQQSTKLKNTKRKRLVTDVKVEIRDKRGGRFLMWNDEGWWNELFDEDLIGQKIEYQLRMVRKSVLQRETLSANAKAMAILGGESTTPLVRSDEKELAEAVCFFVEQCFPTTAGSIYGK